MNYLKRLFPSRSESEVMLMAFKMTTPMLWASNPQLVKVDDKQTKIVMPLTWFTKNGWNTMFFAAIAAGVDLTGGFYSFSLAEKNNLGVLYKDVAIEFKRRVDGPLTLVATENAAVKAACEEAAESGQRVNVPVTVDGYCLESFGEEKPVVSAKATLSIKRLK
jgi:acyl-coenzyme A thioesterase PaaI-like protein